MVVVCNVRVMCGGVVLCGGVVVLCGGVVVLYAGVLLCVMWWCVISGLVYVRVSVCQS